MTTKNVKNQTNNRAAYQTGEVAASPCWACRGEHIGDQPQAQRAALCAVHLRHRVRLLMGLAA